MAQKDKHVRETLQAFSVISQDARYDESYDNLKDHIQKGERITMCKVLDAVEARGEARGVKRGVQRGQLMATAKNLQNLMENTHVSLESAMNMLSIPEEDRPFYRDIIKQ